MRKPDKYPLIDPRLPRLYARILEAAQAMRSVRQMESALGWAELRAKRLESLTPLAIKKRALEEALAVGTNGCEGA